MTETGKTGTFTIQDGKVFLEGTEISDLKIDKKSYIGTITVSENGQTNVAISNGSWCALKDSETHITISDYVEGECKIQVTVIELVKSKVGEETSGYEGCTGTGKLVKVEHSNALEEESKVSYRYQGKCPNNYVTFNGEDAGWRIIGIVDGKIKLIREESIGTFSWDNKDTTTGAEHSQGKNEWTEARLMKLLNPTYEDEEVGGSLYWNRQSGKCYAGQSNGTIECDFSSTGLTVEAQNMIDQNSKWYLGGWNTADITKDEMYEKERGKTTWNDSRETEWTGAIGLMYPSDYGYAAGEGCEQTLYYYDNTTCRNVNWLDKSMEWTITHHSLKSYTALFVYSGGNVSYNISVFNSFGVRPTLYLQSNVKISGGDGTPTNPYILSM